MSGRIDGRYETRYSEILAGSVGNHRCGHRFDHSPGGYIGISTKEPDGTWGDRVLLSPAQAKALVVFIESRGRSTVKRAATKGGMRSERSRPPRAQRRK